MSELTSIIITSIVILYRFDFSLLCFINFEGSMEVALILGSKPKRQYAFTKRNSNILVVHCLSRAYKVGILIYSVLSE